MCFLEAAAAARAGRGGDPDGGDPDGGDPDGGDADGDPVWIDPGAGGIHNTHTTRGHGAPGRCPDARLDATESCEECGDGVDNDGDGRFDCDDPDCVNNPYDCGGKAAVLLGRG